MNNVWQRSFFSLMLLASFITQTKVIEVTEQNAQSTIDAANRIVIIDFYTDWCPPCKMMKPVFENLSDKLGDSYIFVKANAEQLSSFSRLYGVRAYPTFVIIGTDKKELGKIVGYKNADKFVMALNEIVHPINLKKSDKKALSSKLLEALQFGTVEDVKKLIDAGVDLEAPFEDGSTPLFLAVMFAPMNIEVGLKKIQLLCDAGILFVFDYPGQGKQNIDNMLEQAIAQTQGILAGQKKVRELLQKEEAQRSKKNQK